MITLDEALDMINNIPIRCSVQNTEAIDISDVESVIEEIYESIEQDKKILKRKEVKAEQEKAKEVKAEQEKAKKYKKTNKRFTKMIQEQDDKFNETFNENHVEYKFTDFLKDTILILRYKLFRF